MTTGVLFTGLCKKINGIAGIIKKHFLKKLYIHMTVQNVRHPNQIICKNIADLYSSTERLFPNLDVRIILDGITSPNLRFANQKLYQVDVVILSKNCSNQDMSGFIKQGRTPAVFVVDDLDENETILDKDLVLYENVVLGGTFDRLHTGHKILLSEALVRCTKKLTVGVTDTCMLKSKKLWELIEPCDQRILHVKSFVEDVTSNIECDVVAIQDMYGPTKNDPTFNLLVVSDETIRGGDKVNEARHQYGLPPLDIHCVPLVQDVNHALEEESKVSSSNTRMRLLGTRLKEPHLNLSLPMLPYIIGLTGGIASGKSSIGKQLEEMGAGLVDCDKVAHMLYQKDGRMFQKVIDTFGASIVGSDGEIDRKTLGAIVFGDKNKLELLNQLLWPEVLKESLAQCQKLYIESKKNVVIMEAAVLLRAGWQANVHEVWTSIIPSEEAVKRLMERNSLSDAAARERVAAQPSNSEQVSIAHVVFSTFWSREFTRTQIEKAWALVNHKVTDLSRQKL